MLFPIDEQGTAGADGGGELTQDRHRHLPAHAGVGDALADGEAGAVGQILAAGQEETLEQYIEAGEQQEPPTTCRADARGAHRCVRQPIQFACQFEQPAAPRRATPEC